jgi:hypothetical protein
MTFTVRLWMSELCQVHGRCKFYCLRLGVILASLSIIIKIMSAANFFLIGIVGGGIQGPLGTAATSRPIVPAPGDYDDEKLVE